MPLAAVIAGIPTLIAVPLAAVIAHVLTLITVPRAAVIVFRWSPEGILKGGRPASAFSSVAPRAAVAAVFVLFVVRRTLVSTLAVAVVMMA